MPVNTRRASAMAGKAPSSPANGTPKKGAKAKQSTPATHDRETPPSTPSSSAKKSQPHATASDAKLSSTLAYPTSSTKGFSEEAKPSPPAKSKAKTKIKVKKLQKKQQSTTFASSVIGGLTRLIAVCILAYALLVCPADEKEANPVCLTIMKYKSTVLEPYVFLPIRTFAAHPLVAPQIATVSPYVARVGRVSEPYVNEVKHLYRHKIAPRVHMLEIQARPYTMRVQREIDERVMPYIRPVYHFLVDCYRVVEPYLMHIIAFVQKQWADNVQPHLTPLWARCSDVASRWFFTNVYDPSGDLRRKYVDKHIGKMLEKFEEMSDGKPVKGADEDGSSIFVQAGAVPDATPDSTSEAAAESLLRKRVVEEEPVVAFMPGAVMPPETASEVDEDDDLDVIAFLSSLTAEPTTTTSVQPTETVSRMTPEERKGDNAYRRADVERRTAEWERKLKVECETQMKQLKETLLAIRTRAANEIKSGDGALGDEVQGLQEQADKGIDGVDKFVKNLMKKRAGGAEKVALLENIIDKVRKKFEGYAVGVNTRVQEWWVEVLNEEDAEVKKAADTVENLAGNAQGDIGLSWAFLDDVTHLEWKRYHALAGSAKEQADTYRAVANGTHSSAPENPLSLALSDLQVELQDIMIAFELTLADTRSQAMRFLFGHEKSPEEVARDGQESSEGKSSEGARQPEVSILPVSTPAGSADPKVSAAGAGEGGVPEYGETSPVESDPSATLTPVAALHEEL
ncbi:hypothetical protein BOTBODRAFT_175869 [Botryobasidium botryosum FD-172 SS1]|uniref:Uncharacterized protein n=1 Tax=Botryobasidium botryosum (strain FD-172 SS1) TaxID=930990 RepID=A0A067MM82_BOTB1|nr:hypothetical protein BOTBODRAFT_175869 [Botryobasidium botryosum FD-172 SS1]